jgi:hypothetical protein
MNEMVEKVLYSVGLEVGADGGVGLLHATTIEKAWEIIETASLVSRRRDGLVYVASAPEIASDLGRDVLLPVRIKVDDLHVHRRWPVELDRPIRRWEFSVEGPTYSPLAVGRRAFVDAALNAGQAGAVTLDFQP